MLKKVILKTVHRTEDMWLSRYQDVFVRDGTLAHLIADTVLVPRSKFSCCFFRPCTGKMCLS